MKRYMTSKGDIKAKLYAILETLSFLTTFIILLWYFEASKYFMSSWIAKSIMIILAFIGIAIHKKPKEYGLIPKNIKFSVKWSLLTLLLFFGISLFVNSVGLCLGFSTLSIRTFNPYTTIKDLVWYLVMVAFAEELFFRGYIQSRLNKVFRREFSSIFGYKFKWHMGTLIAGFFYFGLSHVFVYMNPFVGSFKMSLATIAIALLAGFFGVIVGIIREKTGSIIVATSLHFSHNYIISVVSSYTNSLLTMIGLVIAYLIFFSKVFLGKLLSEELESFKR